MGVNDLSEHDFAELYGAWQPRTPADVAELFEGYAGTWFVAGGWAIEAFTGVAREHGDIDPSALRRELPLLRRHLAARGLHAWMADSGSLTPLLPDDRPDAAAAEVLGPGCSQLWTRRRASEPWLFDLLLTPGTSDAWVFKRDDRVRLPMERALWTKDGIRYLRPEVQLLHKARALRDKDQRDFDVTVPLLDRERREWLRSALVLTSPGHPWLDALRG